VAQVDLSLAIFGVGGGAGAKALLEANDGDTYGCRFLLGGIVMALHVLPHHERWGKPLNWLIRSDSDGTMVPSPPWRRFLSRWWSLRRGTMESRLAAALNEGF
jgi:hypothetical protein